MKIRSPASIETSDVNERRVADDGGNGVLGGALAEVDGGVQDLDREVSRELVGHAARDAEDRAAGIQGELDVEPVRVPVKRVVEHGAKLDREEVPVQSWDRLRPRVSGGDRVCDCVRQEAASTIVYAVRPSCGDAGRTTGGGRRHANCTGKGKRD